MVGQGLLQWYAHPGLRDPPLASILGGPFSSPFPPYYVAVHLYLRWGWQGGCTLGWLGACYLGDVRWCRLFCEAVPVLFFMPAACLVCLGCSLLSIFSFKESGRGCDNSSFFLPTHLCSLLLLAVVLLLQWG